jgi:hypothetical protein
VEPQGSRPVGFGIGDKTVNRRAEHQIVAPGHLIVQVDAVPVQTFGRGQRQKIAHQPDHLRAGGAVQRFGGIAAFAKRPAQVGAQRENTHQAVHAPQRNGQRQTPQPRTYAKPQHPGPVIRHRLAQQIHQVGPRYRNLTGRIHWQRPEVPGMDIALPRRPDKGAVLPGRQIVQRHQAAGGRDVPGKGMVQYDQVMRPRQVRDRRELEPVQRPG